MKSINYTQVIKFTMFLMLLALMSAGCATNGRYVLLKEYGPTVPEGMSQSLNGKTICIKGFESSAVLTQPEPTGKPEEFEEFKFVNFTKEQNDCWTKEFKQTKKDTKGSEWKKIGSLRNLFGMEMSGVYALNDPGVWLAQTLKADLESQGATMVSPEKAETADVCLSGNVQFCRVDSYMKIWGDLVVDIEVRPKGGTSYHKLLHTSGGTPAWVDSTAEFYKPLRECRQKLSVLVAREIVKPRD